MLGSLRFYTGKLPNELRLKFMLKICGIFFCSVIFVKERIGMSYGGPLHIETRCF